MLYCRTRRLATRYCSASARSTKPPIVCRAARRYCASSAIPRLTVCIDLNETLICSNPVVELPEWYEDDEDTLEVGKDVKGAEQKFELLSKVYPKIGDLRKLTWNKWFGISAKYKEKFKSEEHDPFDVVRKNIFRGVSPTADKIDLMLGKQKVWYRPDLLHFVKEIKELENVQAYLYTAAKKEFADAVTNNFAPDFFAKKFYDDTVKSQGGKKPLRSLETPIERTVLIENSFKAIEGQEENCIHVPSFRAWDFQVEEDATLLHVLQVIRQIRDKPDVRPELDVQKKTYDLDRGANVYAVREHYYEGNLEQT